MFCKNEGEKIISHGEKKHTKPSSLTLVGDFFWFPLFHLSKTFCLAQDSPNPRAPKFKKLNWKEIMIKEIKESEAGFHSNRLHQFT